MYTAYQSSRPRHYWGWGTGSTPGKTHNPSLGSVNGGHSSFRPSYQGNRLFSPQFPLMHWGGYLILKKKCEIKYYD